MNTKVSHSIFPLLILFSLVGSIPFGIRTTLVSFSLYNTENPFLSFFLYHLDLLALLLIGWGLLFHVKHSESNSQSFLILWSLFLLFIVCNTVSIFWTPFPELTILQTTRLFLGGSLIAFLGPLIRNYWYLSILVFVISIVIASLVGVLQVLFQHDLGISLFSEAQISPNTDGVAKVDWGNQTLVRGYAFFPHPNILGFSIFSALSVLFLYYKTRLSVRVPRGTYSLFGYILLFGGLIGAMLVDHYILTSAQAFYMGVFLLLFLINQPYTHPPRIPSVVLWPILIMLLVGGIVSWSHAMMPFIFAFILLIASVHHVPQIFVTIQAVLHRISRYQWILGGSLVGIFAIIGSISFIEADSLRVQYIQRSFEIIAHNPWSGVGIHQYVAALPKGLPLWQYEPVHNVFLLILSETGLIGGGLLFIMLVYAIKILQSRI